MAHKGNKLDTWIRRLILVSCYFLSSCSTVGFYSQAFKGQLEIMRKARPVPAVMMDPKTKPLLKQKLAITRDILAYAETHLGLPAKGQYERYSNLGRRYVVWVIFAAPEFSVEAKRWWYPLVGSVKYRGFFREDLALAESAKLKEDGLDVYVAGVEAYSTLGYLKDPLLNTFIGRDDADLAELIFHELTHQRIYLNGDTDFNEALATAVGREGTRRWLKAHGRMDELEEYERETRLETEFVHELLRTRQELKNLYADQKITDEKRRQIKQETFTRLRSRLEQFNRRQGGTLKLDRWFKTPVNNARLNTAAAYHDLVPAFEKVLKECGGDLEAFLKQMEGMRAMPPRVRRSQLKLAVPSPVPAH
nr:aminopeptidase [Prosthecobacter debontii]